LTLCLEVDEKWGSGVAGRVPYFQHKLKDCHQRVTTFFPIIFALSDYEGLTMLHLASLGSTLWIDDRIGMGDVTVIASYEVWWCARAALRSTTALGAYIANSKLVVKKLFFRHPCD
jgi:hypothetical protein